MWGTIFIITLDTQFLVGLGLYAFLSPFTKIAFQDFAGAITNGSLRFWSVEHIAGMIVGIALAHIGRHRRPRRHRPDRSRHVQLPDRCDELGGGLEEITMARVYRITRIYFLLFVVEAEK
jgi:hypothetical protein